MIYSRDIRIYNLALKVAELSDCPQKHGSIITDGSTIVGIGHNKKRTHPVSHKHGGKATCHAEMIAIVNARRDLLGLTLYSARCNGSRNSKPCDLCSFLLREAEIKYIVYSQDGILRKDRL